METGRKEQELSLLSCFAAALVFRAGPKDIQKLRREITGPMNQSWLRDLISLARQVLEIDGNGRVVAVKPTFKKISKKHNRTPAEQALVWAVLQRVSGQGFLLQRMTEILSLPDLDKKLGTRISNAAKPYGKFIDSVNKCVDK